VQLPSPEDFYEILVSTTKAFIETKPEPVLILHRINPSKFNVELLKEQYIGEITEKIEQYIGEITKKIGRVLINTPRFSKIHMLETTNIIYSFQVAFYTNKQEYTIERIN